MNSGVLDKNGREVKVGDWLAIPYTTPFGELTDQEEYRVEVVFEHGCFGFYHGIRFYPLFEWQSTGVGEYISNQGNRIVYTGEYPFWVID